ncbi:MULTISPECIES: YihY/virulence factor BrkB family protein [unclassified Streptomyces]|uniref:YihY/virulence factor BrkB family protein n=1 Tax=unclassified Streptomyces TaxID=2593676 RepID=UPI002E34BCB0|nr:MULTISPECIES: YihY/virulence factor BrkB family protein [unclassified Streptomyces]
MNRAEVVVRRVDQFQQRHAVLGLPFAVMQKFGNDQAGGKATLIAWYGMFAIFPLLLLFSTILGFVLGGHPALEHRLVTSALANFPVLGSQLRSSAHPLRGSGLALVLGLLGAVYGTQGLGQASLNAMNTIWNVPFKLWPGYVGRQLRGFTVLVLLGLAILMSTTLAGLGSGLGALAGPWTWAVAALVNFGVFLVAFTVLTAATVRVRDVLVGAALATAFWQVLQAAGTFYVRHAISHASDIYGFFAILIGLLSWLYIGARLTLLAAEINVVLRYRLWPRSMTQPPFTAQDKAAFVLLAKMEERRPEQTVAVRFSAEADRQPLTDPPPSDAASAPNPVSGSGETDGPQEDRSALDPTLARERLRSTMRHLAAEACMLVTAPEVAREHGLAGRIADLQRAARAAHRAGVPAELITAETGLDAACVRQWTTADPRDEAARTVPESGGPSRP